MNNFLNDWINLLWKSDVVDSMYFDSLKGNRIASLVAEQFFFLEIEVFISKHCCIHADLLTVVFKGNFLVAKLENIAIYLGWNYSWSFVFLHHSFSVEVNNRCHRIHSQPSSNHRKYIRFFSLHYQYKSKLFIVIWQIIGKVFIVLIVFDKQLATNFRIFEFAAFGVEEGSLFWKLLENLRDNKGTVEESCDIIRDEGVNRWKSQSWRLASVSCFQGFI